MKVLYVALAVFWFLPPSLSVGADSESKPGTGSVSAANSRDTDFRVSLSRGDRAFRGGGGRYSPSVRPSIP